MTKKDICFFYEYIEKLVWETKNVGLEAVIINKICSY